MSKPSFMYCDKINKFKSFGCGKEGTTIMCFPVVAISLAIVLYLFFLITDIMINMIPKNVE